MLRCGAFTHPQGGGLACLDPEGLAEIQNLIEYYLENAKILRDVRTNWLVLSVGVMSSSFSLT